jgi:hypothetical protein
VRRFSRYLPLFVLPLVCLQFANAQTGVDIGVGFGAANAPATKTGLDANLSNCVIGSSGCQQTPSLNTFMIGFGADLMLWKHFGIGVEANIEPGKKDYVTLQQAASGGGIAFTEKLQSRVTFYDINAILQPVATKRASLKLEGGIGAANIKFYDSSSSSSGLLGNQKYTQYFASANHFQMHAGVGVQLYLKEHVFIRPQVDLHYVHNLEQFGRNAVLRYSVWLGYTLGGQ